MYTENLLRELSFSKKVSGSSAGNSGSEPSPPPFPGEKDYLKTPFFQQQLGNFRSEFVTVLSIKVSQKH
jgi:hypothetical protein